MDTAKRELVEEFIYGCQELGLSIDESVELTAHSLICAVSASGKSYAKIEVDNVGVVEVEC